MTNSAANITGLNAASQASSSVGAALSNTAIGSISGQASPQSQSTPSPVLSPHFAFDPTAGIVVQYLNSAGQVQSQIPSTTALAYLRAGLTAQGLTKTQNTQA